MENRVKNVANRILDLLFPKRCPICEEIFPINENINICRTCREKLNYIGEPRCEKCGQPLDNEVATVCFDCYKKEHHYEKGWSLWLYDESVKKSIHRFKYQNNYSYGLNFANEIVYLYSDTIQKSKVDLVIPVPLHRKRQRQRGYNQSAYIASNIARLLKMDYDPSTLARVIHTEPQKDLSDKQRSKNLKNAFRVRDTNKIHDRVILLVDDVYTTGSTIDSCAKELIAGGAKKVYFFTVAIGKGF